jgi:aspartate carbamoyltransferase
MPDTKLKLHNQDILSIDQFSRDDLDELYALAKRIVEDPEGFMDVLSGKIVTELFYEPSTRTFSSFDAAIKRLGGSATSITGVKYSSVSKGETFEDTVLTLSQYADAIVLRHPEVGAAKRAAEVSPIPIINAGDGIGEHPTQALLDGFTILSSKGSINDIVVTMVGDLKNGRTVHSLSRLLARYKNVKVNYVAPPSLRMPKDLITELTKQGLQQEEHDNLEEVIASSDVIYMTRTQQERFTSQKEYEAVKDAFIIDLDTMKKAKKDMILMHPLPRVGEIDERVDSDPRAVYFQQARNGMFVRMALLASILGTK